MTDPRTIAILAIQTMLARTQLQLGLQSLGSIKGKEAYDERTLNGTVEMLKDVLDTVVLGGYQEPYRVMTPELQAEIDEIIAEVMERADQEIVK